jgi:hypothetical protein
MDPYKLTAGNTICAKCANLYRKEPPSSPRYNIWYNLLCMASPLPEVVDPVSGETGYASTNDLGRGVIGENPWMYCRDVNHGNCPKYYPGDEE